MLNNIQFIILKTIIRKQPHSVYQHDLTITTNNTIEVQLYLPATHHSYVSEPYAPILTQLTVWRNAYIFITE